MQSWLPRTQLVVDTCKNYLDEFQAWGTEVESYLTQHILVILCAEIQQEFYEIIEKRVSLTSDNELKDFAVSSGKRVLRSIQKDEIATFVGLFGQKARSHLNDNLKEQDITTYNNAVRNRHNIAHKTGANTTFRELESILLSARKVLSVSEKAISLDRDAHVKD